MRVLLDTHIFAWYINEPESLSQNVKVLIDDYENQVYVSSETLRELVILWRSKREFRTWWKDPVEMLRSVEEHYFQILYLHQEHYERCARLELAPGHNDPADHLIIATALVNAMPLISADTKFPFYRNQGLDLIENN